jgi:hypothetical protein
MLPMISPKQPEPRTYPLVIDRVAPYDLIRCQAYIEAHGGSWMTIADGGSVILFPQGTLQWLEQEDEHISIYTIQFPDKAVLTWRRMGYVPTRGFPASLCNQIMIPER